MPPAGALRLRDGGRPLGLALPALAVVRPRQPSRPPGPPQAAKSMPLDPSRSARWSGRRDDGDGMGPGRNPVRGARPTQLLSHICPVGLDAWGVATVPDGAKGHTMLCPMAPSGMLSAIGGGETRRPRNPSRPRLLGSSPPSPPRLFAPSPPRLFAPSPPRLFAPAPPRLFAPAPPGLFPLSPPGLCPALATSGQNLILIRV
jgi:hypothetical protein